MLSTVNMFRNVCAHDSRLYCYRILDINKQISDMPIHNYLNIDRHPTQNWLLRGKQDLYSAVVALKYLIDDQSFSSLIDDLKVAISDLNSKIVTITINDVLDKMGFPIANSTTGQKNWDEIKTLPKF